MDAYNLRLLLALVLAIHGIGHFQGILASTGLIKTKTWHYRSWLLGSMDDGIVKVFGLVIWLIGFFGFIAAAFCLMDWLLPHGWWRMLAIISAFVSLAGTVVFWNGLAAIINKVGAIAVNLAVIVCLLILAWPAEASIGF